MDQNRGIGFNNELLAHLPNDLSYFKRHTKGKVCVQGRKTYESIISQLGHDLPERINVVLTKNKKFTHEQGAFVYHSVEEVLNEHQSLGGDEEIMVIGGAQVYSQALPYVNKLYLTIIHHEFSDVDTYFPKIDLSEWKVSSHVLNKADENHLYDYSFITYERKR